MIPKATINVEIISAENVDTNRTYRIVDNRIQGFIDGLEALKQTIYKVLNTEKYQYPIYSFNYGIELESLLGKDRTYVQIELKRRIRECLLQDKRITDVNSFSFQTVNDNLLCTFTVLTIYGNIPVTQEVRL